MSSDNKNQKGVSVLLVILMMSIILSIGLGISGILVQQTKLLKDIGYSVVAFSAADSGIEQYLYKLYKSPPLQSQFSDSCGSAVYTVQTKCGHKNTNCPSGITQDDSLEVYFWAKSVGAYQGIKRAIEINN